MTVRVGILGCGYVGLELGRQLRDGHEVVGVRRSSAGASAIERAGFEAVRADVTEPETLASVPDVDALVFAASSGGRDAAAAREVYVGGQETVIEHFASRDDPPDQYLYTSSTGVYGDHDGEWVDESTPLEPTTEKAAVLRTAESVALDRGADAGFDATVARVGGIYGPERYRLDRYLEGPVTPGYRNVIHRDDAAGAVSHLLRQPCPHDVVLVVDDEPVDRWTFADWLADECGRPRPEKRSVEDRHEDGDGSERGRRRRRSQKRCRNDRLRELGYEFRFPTYESGYRAAIDRYRAERDGTQSR